MEDDVFASSTTASASATVVVPKRRSQPPGQHQHVVLVPPASRPSSIMSSRRTSAILNQPIRVGSVERPDRGEGTTSKCDSLLGDRASSKLTLDDELYDILYAFSESDAFLSKPEDKETDEDGKPLTRHALLERIRQKKEVIGKLRCQAWNMARKRRTLKLAQKYLEQNESKVSRSHLFMEEIRKRGRLMKRSFSNFASFLIPWEGKIKKIESHFGSVVSSYFTFLRWIVFVNVIITLIVVSFIVIPESLADAAADPGRRNRTMTRKRIPEAERQHADEWAVVWHYDGYLRYSSLFYGFYSDDEFLGKKVRYALPLAYFLVTMTVFAYSLFAILRKMAGNARMSKLSGSRAEQYIYNWKVFTGWDYTIGNQETASNTVMAVVIKLRESIADSRVAHGSQFHCLQFTLRVIANLIICAMLAFSIFVISIAVQRGDGPGGKDDDSGYLFSKNQAPSVVSTITHVFPMIFDLVGRMENYHPRTALRAHLTRVLVLYVFNYLTFIVALFDKMDAMQTVTEPRMNTTRTKRQMGGRNPYIPRPPPFASRTFENRSDMMLFIDRAPSRLGRILERTTRSYNPRPTVSVAPQFGPVNINNADAILRNGTYDRAFESKRVGPQPIPMFTPPPRTIPTNKPSHLRQQFGGPDFEPVRKNMKPDDYVPIRKRPTTASSSTSTSSTSHSRSSSTSPSTTTSSSSRSATTSTTSRAERQFDKPTTGRPSHRINGRTELIKPDPTQPSERDLNNNIGDEVELGDAIRNGTSTMQMAVTAERRAERTDKCWETYIGQEIVRLVTMDLIVTVVSILVIDFMRGLWIKYCSSWWCWDIESTFPEYGEFKVAENVLHIINNQGMIWLGLFFSPMLPVLNNIKLIILMYIRGWAVMTCNVPARELYRASRSSNFYLLILLLWLLLCTLPVGYVIASTAPSRSCGPFARHDHFYSVLTVEIEKRVDETVLGYIKKVASPGVVVPILLFLLLIIYFLVSLVRGLREANSDLQKQLVHERTEEKKKIFELAGGGKKKTDERKDRNKHIQYLPPVEQQRREPWRQFVDDQQPAHVSDSSESEDDDEGSEKADVVARVTIPPVASSTAETLNALHFHPSLASLIEQGEEVDDEDSDPRDLVSADVLSQSASGSVLYQSKARFDSPTETEDIQSDVIEIATPEEIRILYEKQSKNQPEIHRSPIASDREAAGQPTEFSAKSSTSSTKFEPKDTQPDFQPWPSIDEVKLRKEKLQKRSPLAFIRPMAVTELSSPPSSSTAQSTNGQPTDARPPVPTHRRVEQVSDKLCDSGVQSSTDDERRSQSPSRRFRISVSPTKQIRTEDNEKRRLYAIDQSSAAASLNSISPASSEKKTSTAPANNKAPRVVFGDDDSPRVI